MPAAAPPHTTRAVLGMLLVVAIWAANFVAMRLVLAEVPLLVVGALRFTLAGALLTALLAAREGHVRLAPADLWRLLGLGILGNTVYQTLFMLGLTGTTVGNTAILLATSPLLTAAIGALLGVERPSRPLAVGLALALAGAVLVLRSHGFAFGSATVAGDLAALGAAVCWALYTLGVRRLPGGLSPLRVTALTTLAGAPGLILLALPDLPGVAWSEVSLQAWLALGYSVVLSIGLAYWIWNANVATVGPNRTALFNCLTPLLAMLIAWPVLDETPGPVQWVGGTLIIAGVLTGRGFPRRLLGRAAA